MVSFGARCCGQGQRLEAGQCQGVPTACAPGMVRWTGAGPGCAAPAERIGFAGGTLTLGPTDWEAEGAVTARVAKVSAFRLDATEVTLASYRRDCAQPPCEGDTPGEAGLPVTDIDPEQAEVFCRQQGGRLPRSEEWLFAAAGEQTRRFPWGFTGLVCRRAAYGMVDGPCTFGGVGPDPVGSRPAGRTPEGVLDLAGNVAEWTREVDGSYVARGGSFRSKEAAELKSWAREERSGRAGHIGFRCAYDMKPPSPERDLPSEP